MAKNVLILLSHPNFDNSLFSKYLANAVQKSGDFQVRLLDKNMGNGYFNLEVEKNLLRGCNALVWQFPIYWYNCPASLRNWQDQILSPIVYSADNFLKGKPVQAVFTAGAAEKEYGPTGLNRYTAEEMLRPMEMTVNASGMVWKKPLGFYGCSGTPDEKDLAQMARTYEKALQELL